MAKIHYFDIDEKTEAWCAYEFQGADAKCLVCFTTEAEAAEELIILKKSIPKARLIHFLPEEFYSREK